MKVGRGLFGLMSKSHRKCTSCRHSPFLFTTVPAVLGLILLLAGCGDISLNRLLENEEPGEFSISPTEAFVPASGTLDISGTGGFKPYTYENKGMLGLIDPDTGTYTAPSPSSLSGSSETTDIEVSDSFGTTASTTITVFAPIELSPAMQNVKVNDTVNFTATGGVPDPVDGYYFSIDGSAPESDVDGNWPHAFSTEGRYTVEVADSLGNTSISMITVEGNLAIDVEEAWVVINGSLDLAVINAVGAHTFSIDTPGTPAEVGEIYNPLSDPATYNAPGVELVVTIKVEDSNTPSSVATVDIHVVTDAPEKLTFPTTMTVHVNDVVQLTATGGIEPHTFWLEGPGSLSAHPVQENRIRYQAPGYATTAYVWVQDALGRQAKTTVNVIEG